MENLQHGIHGTYTNYKCRCPLCKKVHTDWYKVYIRKRRAEFLGGECAVKGCNNREALYKKGVCHMHYQKGFRADSLK